MLAAASPNISVLSYESRTRWRANGERQGCGDGRNLRTGLSKFQGKLYHWGVWGYPNFIRDFREAKMERKRRSTMKKAGREP